MSHPPLSLSLPACAPPSTGRPLTSQLKCQTLPTIIILRNLFPALSPSPVQRLRSAHTAGTYRHRYDTVLYVYRFWRRPAALKKSLPFQNWLLMLLMLTKSPLLSFSMAGFHIWCEPHPGTHSTVRSVHSNQSNWTLEKSVLWSGPRSLMWKHP